MPCMQPLQLHAYTCVLLQLHGLVIRPRCLLATFSTQPLDNLYASLTTAVIIHYTPMTCHITQTVLHIALLFVTQLRLASS